MLRGFLCLSKVFPHAHYSSNTLHFFGEKHWSNQGQIKPILISFIWGDRTKCGIWSVRSESPRISSIHELNNASRIALSFEGYFEASIHTHLIHIIFFYIQLLSLVVTFTFAWYYHIKSSSFFKCKITPTSFVRWATITSIFCLCSSTRI